MTKQRISLAIAACAAVLIGTGMAGCGGPPGPGGATAAGGAGTTSPTPSQEVAGANPGTGTPTAPATEQGETTAGAEAPTSGAPEIEEDGTGYVVLPDPHQMGQYASDDARQGASAAPEVEAAGATPDAMRPAGRTAVESMKMQARSAAVGGLRMLQAFESDGYMPPPPPRGDRFADMDANPVRVTAETPVSTFSIDVDTAAYSYIRATLNAGRLPESDAVRIEEMINYFPYAYAPPATPETPFGTHVTVMPAPWSGTAKLMHVGIKGYAPAREANPRANLVFLIDTSGSMGQPDKLPLLVSSLKLLLGALQPDDRVGIVTYAGTAGVALEPTLVSERATILTALESLTAEGSTAGAEGIRTAYRMAGEHLVADGVNRVILATDGDFNVGITDLDQLEDTIARKREGGVFLSVLGFGRGNYHDALMQRLAQHGNGNAAYIDTLSEARKVLVEEGTSMLFPIAKDVKIQVEFNPAEVSEYRLIGYESRMLAREDFKNDSVDAGEIGTGHTVTALYELTPAGASGERVAPLRYQTEKSTEARADFRGELAFVKIRYKRPDEDTSILISRAVTDGDQVESLEAASEDARLAAAVAGFGELLRGGRYTGDYGYEDVIALAEGARGKDPFGYRAELVELVRLAQALERAER